MSGFWCLAAYLPDTSYEMVASMRAFLSIIAFVLITGIGGAATALRELQRKLKLSEDFRVRVTAALELGKTQRSERARPIGGRARRSERVGARCGGRRAGATR